MSAIDAPPGVAFAGQAAGEFTSRPRAHRLARRVCVYVIAAGALTLALAARRLHAPLIEFLIVAPMVSISVGLVGLAVRRARVRIDRDGVWWGWNLGGVRMRRERLARVRVYRDAIALEPRRGSTWYLSARDWDRFEGIAPALEVAAIGFTRHERRAPLTARLQSYGVVLDGLLVLDAVIATLALAVAIVL